MQSLTYPCFIARIDGRGRWYWSYYVREDLAVADSHEKFVQRQDCEASIRRMKESEISEVYFLDL